MGARLFLRGFVPELAISKPASCHKSAHFFARLVFLIFVVLVVTLSGAVAIAFVIIQHVGWLHLGIGILLMAY